MHNQYLLAIDAGTGSVRAVLFTTNGKQAGVWQEEWEHAEDPRYPGSMDFDWKHNWELACTCVKQVIHDCGISSSDILAVSTTCMREGIVLYDAEGKEIWACANVDARSNDEVALLVQNDPELEKELYAISGQTYALGALPRLLWVKNKMPEVYDRIHRMSMFNDWLIYKLTGILATEPSNGSTTGIFNLESRSWDTSIMEKIGLKTDIFPPVVECGTIVGTVNEQGALQTGLALGTRVVSGGGDAQLGCIGVGVVKPNQAAVFGGSFWQYELNSDKPDTDPDCRVRVNCHALPHLWQQEALAFKPGLVMRWYRDAFCQEEVQRAKKEHTSTYQLLDEKAKEIAPGSYGMMCTFSDVMNYISWKHAAPTFTNFELDAGKFNKYTFYRAIMENTAYVTKGHMELVGNKSKEVVFAGGASKSALWCQILSDVLGIPVKVPVVKEATALGTAILAGYGIGLYGDIQKATESLVSIDTIYYPDATNHATYERLYEIWRKVYEAQLALSVEKVTQYMWVAPGI